MTSQRDLNDIPPEFLTYNPHIIFSKPFVEIKIDYDTKSGALKLVNRIYTFKRKGVALLCCLLITCFFILLYLSFDTETFFVSMLLSILFSMIITVILFANAPFLLQINSISTNYWKSGKDNIRCSYDPGSHFLFLSKDRVTYDLHALQGIFITAFIAAPLKLHSDVLRMKSKPTSDTKIPRSDRIIVQGAFYAYLTVLQIAILIKDSNGIWHRHELDTSMTDYKYHTEILSVLQNVLNCPLLTTKFITKNVEMEHVWLEHKKGTSDELRAMYENFLRKKADEIIIIPPGGDVSKAMRDIFRKAGQYYESGF